MGTVILIIAGVALLIACIALMPSFPATPPELQNFTSSLADFVQKPVEIMVYLFGTWLVILLFTTVIAIWVAEPVYHGVMWVLRKIPVLNIK